MTSIGRFLDGAATTVSLSFCCFSAAGLWEVLSSGAGAEVAYRAAFSYGFLSVPLALCTATALSTWNAISNRKKSPQGVGLASTILLMSVLCSSYVLYWIHIQVLVGVPWFAITSLLVTGVFLVCWLGATLLLVSASLRFFVRKRASKRTRRFFRYATRTLAPAVIVTGMAVLFFERTLDTGTQSIKVAAPERPNVVLIVLDAMRADFTSAFGHQDPTTPSFDRIAREGLLFTDAHATSSWTLPSVTSIMISQVAGLDVRPGISKAMIEGVTLPEVLADLGYVTMAVSDNPYVSGPFGLERQFHLRVDGRSKWAHRLKGTVAGTIVERLFPVHDGTLVQRTIEKMVRLPRPFFIYLHLMGGHAPYRTPPGYVPTFEIKDVARKIDFPSPELRIRPEELDALLARYAVSIRYADDQVSRLLAAIQAAGLSRSTLVVVTSDHGEEFGEHGGWLHGKTLHREVLHVPLALRWPGKVLAGGRRADIVSLLDLAPTIVGAVAPGRPGLIPSSWQGADLEITATGGLTRDNRGVLAELAPSLRCFVTNRWKYIVDLATGSEWLFDRHEDPTEMENVASLKPDTVSQLSRELEAHIGAARSPLKLSKADATDPEVLKRLRSLGYIK